MMEKPAVACGAHLDAARLVFWDFDGVIKESVAVKTVAFEMLFAPYGDEIARKVRQHHEAHGGVSRYEKMPTYLRWAGEPATAGQVEEFCSRFSGLVLQAVIDADWVPGVREYLLANRPRRPFVVVTATPEQEMQQILSALRIAHCFAEVHGAPTPKAHAIGDVLQRVGCAPEQALVVGDSESDLEAARANSVPFVLRRTPLNTSLQQRHGGLMFDCLANG